MIGSKTITIDIDPYGNPTIEGHGFHGTECNKAMDAYEQAFDATDSQKKNKPELNMLAKPQQTGISQTLRR